MLDQELVRSVVEYFNNNESTVRKTADVFGISKSIVYDYLTVILPNPRTKEILAKNKAEAASRGGQATRKKYQKERSQ